MIRCRATHLHSFDHILDARTLRYRVNPLIFLSRAAVIMHQHLATFTLDHYR